MTVAYKERIKPCCIIKHLKNKHGEFLYLYGTCGSEFASVVPLTGDFFSSSFCTEHIVLSKRKAGSYAY